MTRLRPQHCLAPRACVETLTSVGRHRFGLCGTAGPAHSPIYGHERDSYLTPLAAPRLPPCVTNVDDPHLTALNAAINLVRPACHTQLAHRGLIGERRNVWVGREKPNC